MTTADWKIMQSVRKKLNWQGGGCGGDGTTPPPTDTTTSTSFPSSNSSSSKMFVTLEEAINAREMHSQGILHYCKVSVIRRNSVTFNTTNS